MKKVFIILVSVVLVGIILVGLTNNVDRQVKENDYLRIHIRANSNEKIDQEIKYEVKNAIVDFLSPYVANLTSVSESKRVVSKKLSEIENVANETLTDKGFNYNATVSLRSEYFPDRSYDDYFLKEGIYDALIVELGSGKGNNWWCVVFPPLCFVNAEETSDEKIEYKSKLVEIINNFK